MLQYKTYHFNSLASTQDKAKEFSKKGLSNLIIVADMQTKGRGRFKRKWHSGKGGLWMSILLKPKSAGNLQYLTFAAAIAVVRSIKKIANLKTSIKWPNDVHYKGRKLCGILTEGIFGRDNYAAIGIGLNVNQEKLPDEIKNIAISLKEIKQKKTNIKRLTKSVIEQFFVLYHDYHNKGKFEKILEIWKRYCDTINKNVVVITQTKAMHGKAIGIDKDCNLLLKSKDNRVIKVVEGDIHVRY